MFMGRDYIRDLVFGVGAGFRGVVHTLLGQKTAKKCPLGLACFLLRACFLIYRPFPEYRYKSVT